MTPAALAALVRRSPALIVNDSIGDELWIFTEDMSGATDAYRATFFSVDGPRGHRVRPTLDVLCREIAPEVQTARAASDDDVIKWTSTVAFVEGSKQVAYTQAWNELGYFASLLPDREAREAAYDARRRADQMTDLEAATAYLNRVIHAMPKPNPSARSARFRSYRQNPTPWVTSLLARTFTQLESKVPPQWLPKIDKVKPAGKRFSGELTEFGCGAFGCVLPTLDPSVVLKVTSDESEARFARELAGKLPTPICVVYHRVSHIEGAKRQGREVYLLWREESASVGKIDEIVGQHAENAIADQHQAAMNAFGYFQDGEIERGRRAMDAWRKACRAMGKLPELAFVADGLIRAADEAGILICDVHGGNLGLCPRNGSPTWVITDPGNVVVL